MTDRNDNSSGGPRLVIRANPLDLGARPISPSWQSTDILDMASNTPLVQVTPGVPVYLAASVQNVGTEVALAVRVNFWWADSSLGIAQAAATFIGNSGAPRTMVQGDSFEFPCTQPWIPEALSQGAHPCIVVEAEGVNCPVHNSFRPDLDPQVGQANLTFAPSSSKQPLKLVIFNPFSRPAKTTVQVSTLLVSGAHARELALSHLLHARLPEQRIALRESGVVVADLDAHEFLRLIEVKTSERHDHRETKLGPPNGYRAHTPAGRPLFELSLPAGGSAEIVLEGRPSRLGRFDMLIHQISQISEGFVVGGYTLVQG